jgi:regulator of sigma E protease
VQLFSGAVGIRELSGPVGIVSAINTVGNSGDSVKENLMNVAYFIAFIAINLAFMNMLPIPALDGGRVVFLIITGLIEALTHRHINPKYEGYIHAGAMVLLFGLMGFTFINDIIKLVAN